MSTKNDMERAMLAKNQCCFNQASTTPFMVPPLSEVIDPLGVGQATQDILDGTFDIPPGMDEYTAELIPLLKWPDHVVPGSATSLDLPVDSHINGWKKQQCKQTSLGPLGIHFGHFQAGATNPVIAEVDTIMTNYPYKSGYSPARWQHGTNVMLEKKKGNF